MDINAVNKNGTNNNSISPTTDLLADVLSLKLENEEGKAQEFPILRKSNSKIEGEKFGIQIINSTPIFFLGGGAGHAGGYHPDLGIILMFQNGGDDVLKHEIIHSVECKKEIPQELYFFYDKVKSTINSNSFGLPSSSTIVDTLNFKKDIHEFLADGYCNEKFIHAMKKENLYDDFLQKTKYLSVYGDTKHPDLKID